MNNNETIAAISTSSGNAGIGIVRMSGDKALVIAGKIFRPAGEDKINTSGSHAIHYGHILGAGSSEIVDEVLLSVMLAPRTYTKEDVIEINCHGGKMSPKKVLELCLDCGARLAEPGEFTKRAFLNGRMDLSQAEAVLDIINAETGIAQKVAVEQLKGGVSCKMRSLKERVLQVLSLIELSIDFSQEDVAHSSREKVTAQIKDIREECERILKDSEKGMILRTGASVVICGRPNVGKSSLMNALLRHDRVIVTPVSGTTRDVIEEAINISGVKIRLSDTAGIIDTNDRVEVEGIKRSKEKLEGADMILFIIDANRRIVERDKRIYDIIKDRDVVIVLNKTDLPVETGIREIKSIFGDKDVASVSALKKEGLDELEDKIAGHLFGGKELSPEDIVITGIRHKKLLEEALQAIKRAEGLSAENNNGELIASDLNQAVFQIGSILGESIDDEVLDNIFSQFCIGK